MTFYYIKYVGLKDRSMDKSKPVFVATFQKPFLFSGTVKDAEISILPENLAKHIYTLSKIYEYDLNNFKIIGGNKQLDSNEYIDIIIKYIKKSIY